MNVIPKHFCDFGLTVIKMEEIKPQPSPDVKNTGKQGLYRDLHITFKWN